MDIQQIAPNSDTITSLFTDALAPFLTGSFWAVALSISALMTTLSKSLKKFYPELNQDRRVGLALTWANLMLGVLAAVPLSYFEGKTFMARLPFGLAAGALSHYLYNLVLRRIKWFAHNETPPVASAAPGTSTAPKDGD
jgi:hypothetical protein